MEDFENKDRKIILKDNKTHIHWTSPFKCGLNMKINLNFPVIAKIHLQVLEHSTLI